MPLLFNSLWDGSLVLFADRFSNPDPAEQAAAGMSGLLCCGLVVGLPFLYLSIVATLSFWMARDAKSRGMEPAMWLIMTLFTGPIGFVYYLFSRPQGMLVQCHNCGNNRMEASIKCPHCGARQDLREELDEDEDEDEHRPLVKQAPFPRRSTTSERAVFPCPNCGVRLRFPKQPLPLGHKFTCPNCQKTIELDTAT